MKQIRLLLLALAVFSAGVAFSSEYDDEGEKPKMTHSFLAGMMTRRASLMDLQQESEDLTVLEGKKFYKKIKELSGKSLCTYFSKILQASDEVDGECGDSEDFSENSAEEVDYSKQAELRRGAVATKVLYEIRNSRVQREWLKEVHELINDSFEGIIFDGLDNFKEELNAFFEKEENGDSKFNPPFQSFGMLEDESIGVKAEKDQSANTNVSNENNVNNSNLPSQSLDIPKKQSDEVKVDQGQSVNTNISQKEGINPPPPPQLSFDDWQKNQSKAKAARVKVPPKKDTSNRNAGTKKNANNPPSSGPNMVDALKAAMAKSQKRRLGIGKKVPKVKEKALKKGAQVRNNVPESKAPKKFPVKKREPNKLPQNPKKFGRKVPARPKNKGKRGSGKFVRRSSKQLQKGPRKRVPRKNMRVQGQGPSKNGNRKKQSLNNLRKSSRVSQARLKFENKPLQTVPRKNPPVKRNIYNNQQANNSGSGANGDIGLPPPPAHKLPPPGQLPDNLGQGGLNTSGNGLGNFPPPDNLPLPPGPGNNPLPPPGPGNNPPPPPGPNNNNLNQHQFNGADKPGDISLAKILFTVTSVGVGAYIFKNYYWDVPKDDSLKAGIRV